MHTSLKAEDVVLVLYTFINHSEHLQVTYIYDNSIVKADVGSFLQDLHGRPCEVLVISR